MVVAQVVDSQVSVPEVVFAQVAALLLRRPVPGLKSVLYIFPGDLASRLSPFPVSAHCVVSSWLYVRVCLSGEPPLVRSFVKMASRFVPRQYE